MKEKKMNSNINKYIVAIVIMALVIIGLLYFIFHKKENIIIKLNDDFIYLTENYDEDKYNNYLFTNYDDYYDVFGLDILDANSFKNNNYVLITIVDDSCSSSDIKPVDYSINDNVINVTAKYKASCGVCATKNIYYLLKIDKNMVNVEVNINYESVNSVKCDSDIAYKPIIYIYPEEKIDLKIKLGNEELITHSYPKYNNLWNISVDTNGNIYDYSTNKNYYALYWEGKNHNTYVHNDGFVVKGEDTIKFLEEKLNILGLNEREINEFIIYWLPKMESNKYNYVRFETKDEINGYMPLEFSKTPDTLIRVYMNFKPLNNKIKVKKQELKEVKRHGFTIVEWGGSLIH